MTGIIILAAGASSRMGKPKQLLIYQQKTLLQRAIQAAVGIPGACIVVVIGANQSLIKPDINNSAVITEYNPNWEQGMASSIRAGINRLITEQPHVENALLMLCDQPFVNTALLQKLIDEKQTGRTQIIALAYQNTIGVPVLFDRIYFDELTDLQGQEGAKKLLKKYNSEIIAVPFEKGAIDIDTPEDYERLLKS